MLQALTLTGALRYGAPKSPLMGLRWGRWAGNDHLTLRLDSTVPAANCFALLLVAVDEEEATAALRRHVKDAVHPHLHIAGHHVRHLTHKEHYWVGTPDAHRQLHHGLVVGASRQSEEPLDEPSESEH